MNALTDPPTVENQRAVSVNLCPDCGTPPLFFLYLNGCADCECIDTGCESYDVEHAESWQAALAKWNENTAKAYAERAESPISDNGEHKPASVEDGAQNGSECDTREKLEAWAHEEIAEKWARSDEDVLLLFTYLYDLMDMQAAITRADYGVYLPQRVAELMGEVDSLTAERDKLRESNQGFADKLSESVYQNSKLVAERDDLRARLKTQANSFQKLERDNAKLRDTLARVRGLVGDA